MAFNKEPEYAHGSRKKTGIIIINLGTPESPTPKAVRKYLAEFLSDSRVVEIPKILWMLILHGIILRIRPRESAKKYKSIWSSEGSPLRYYTEKQVLGISKLLRTPRCSPLEIDFAMRYGRPSIESVIEKQKSRNITNILFVPLYPQYSATTTGSVFDAVAKTLSRTRNMPGIRFIRGFHEHPSYINACVIAIEQYWVTHGKPSNLVLSFHGVPKFSLIAGDPYHCECHKTGRLIAEKLSFDKDKVVVTFQSRFGRAEWLQPYTINTLEKLGKCQTGRVDVFCPGFVSDCLETLEEIAIENRDAYIDAGGSDFHYIPCLNNRQEWVNALATIISENLSGWVSDDFEEKHWAAEEKLSAKLARKMALNTDS